MSPPGERDGLEALAAQLRRNAVASGHRRLVVLAGDAAWCREAATRMATRAAARADDVLWTAESAPDGFVHCPPRELATRLGGEVGALVIDAHDGLDVDGLGAGAGSVRGGGLILLLAPPLDAWPGAADPEATRLAVDGRGVAAVGQRFIARLAGILARDPWTVVCAQGEALPTPAALPGGEPATPPEDPDCRTNDQANAVAAVLRTATGHRRRPTVLTADRGRGKSAALGIAAARFLKARGGSVVVTGPRRSAVASVLRHAAGLLGGVVCRSGVDAGEAGQLRFLLPDELAHLAVPPALVLVDEAAAIPTAVLAGLLRRHGRIVFATTVHGYEGTGRGFALRFQPLLERECRRWRALTLEEPVRWRAGDPVEALLFRALLLDAELPQVAQGEAEVRVERLDRDALAADEPLLRAVFGLLVHAHYRTRPLDLRNLLDGPDLQVVVLRRGDGVVGVALLAPEGGFDATTARAIWAGNRRPRGHLLPQSLASHVGVEVAARLRAQRVMRIAIHPELQGQGLGSRFLALIAADAGRAGFDLLGTSFGATPPLLRFWRRGRMQAVHLGMRRDAASGTHSAVLLQPLTRRGRVVAARARERFARMLPEQLADALSGVETDTTALLLEGLDVPAPGEEDWRDVVGFAFGQRAFEVSLAALRRVALDALAHRADRLAADERDALIARVLQMRPWAEAAGAAGASGRPALIRLLRRAFATLVADAAPPGARRLAGQLDRAPAPVSRPGGTCDE